MVNGRILSGFSPLLLRVFLEVWPQQPLFCAPATRVAHSPSLLLPPPFPQMTGHSLQRTYGKQFSKLLMVIAKHYVPAVERASSDEDKQDAVQLRGFVEDCIRNRNMPVPIGRNLPE